MNHSVASSTVTMLYYDLLYRVAKHFTLPLAPPPPNKPHAHQAVAPHSLSMDLPVLDILQEESYNT